MKRSTSRYGAALMLAVLLTGCHDQVTPEQKWQQDIDAVGLKVQVAAMFTINAAKQCSIGGYPNLQSCSRNTGPLPTDKADAVLAQEAIKQINEAFAECNQLTNVQYCSNLLLRAGAIAERQDLLTPTLP